MMSIYNFTESALVPRYIPTSAAGIVTIHHDKATFVNHSWINLESLHLTFLRTWKNTNKTTPFMSLGLGVHLHMLTANDRHGRH